ncbi:hypothetical protein AX17_005678 [Amanita inopinata Kibby_2008]|nr:hypothetical protein AX17_005678 [Amanita inopinata Kibby_2008]
MSDHTTLKNQTLPKLTLPKSEPLRVPINASATSENADYSLYVVDEESSKFHVLETPISSVSARNSRYIPPWNSKSYYGENTKVALEAAEYDALGQQFTTLVLISTFTAALITAFVTLVHNILRAARDFQTVPFEIGMFFALGGMAVHTGVIIIAGRSAALALKYAKRLPAQAQMKAENLRSGGRKADSRARTRSTGRVPHAIHQCQRKHQGGRWHVLFQYRHQTRPYYLPYVNMHWAPPTHSSIFLLIPRTPTPSTPRLPSLPQILRIPPTHGHNPLLLRSHDFHLPHLLLPRVPHHAFGRLHKWSWPHKLFDWLLAHLSNARAVQACTGFDEQRAGRRCDGCRVEEREEWWGEGETAEEMVSDQVSDGTLARG